MEKKCVSVGVDALAVVEKTSLTSLTVPKIKNKISAIVHKSPGGRFISIPVLNRCKNHFCKKKQKMITDQINSKKKKTATVKSVIIFGRMASLHNPSPTVTQPNGHQRCVDRFQVPELRKPDTSKERLLVLR